MDSPQSADEVHWERLIRGLRGSRAARIWYEYKMELLGKPEPNQDNTVAPVEAGLSDQKAAQVIEEGGLGTECQLSRVELEAVLSLARLKPPIRPGPRIVDIGRL
jgi:hypothetical protein